jgi:hypothetical protein
MTSKLPGIALITGIAVTPYYLPNRDRLIGTWQKGESSKVPA